jgi:uncharacterized protein (TIGR03032 family)
MSRPVFIVAPSRSGSELLLEAFAQSAGIAVTEAALDTAITARCGQRDRLTAADATPEIAAAIREDIAAIAAGSRILDASALNALRVPFLRALFPDAAFVYLYREPGRALRGADELDVEHLARQWTETTSILLDDLESLPAAAWLIAAYHELTTEPKDVIARIAKFLGVDWDGALPTPRGDGEPLPDATVHRIDDTTGTVAARARSLFANTPPRTPRASDLEAGKGDPDVAPFRSVSTHSFPALLQHLGISLVVSTYQSGRLILVRAENTTTLNTHFRMFRSPMGIAVGPGRLAVGTEREVWDYRNQPAVAPKVDPPGKHDACFIPRKIHVTGDIRIHEIGYVGDELWMVNTRFSTLCTLSEDTSFVPRWRPPFVTHLAPEDRCHLNGMAIVGNRVRFVTAFGKTNSAGGWRETKATGGLMLDVDSGEIVLHGLSMPHSPRQHDGRVFVLESGKGTIAHADLATGRVETIAELPGFTRGLAFAGPYAFIGLSQVRESNVFGGIPLTERVAERQCAVYVVDLRSGRTVAFLRFEGDVQEIFDVQILFGIRYPEVLELTSPLVATSFTVPDEMLPEVATTEDQITAT